MNPINLIAFVSCLFLTLPILAQDGFKVPARETDSRQDDPGSSKNSSIADGGRSNKTPSDSTRIPLKKNL